MALKALMLRKKIDGAKKELEALRAKNAEFALREQEIEKAIDEANTDEEKKAVEESIDAFDSEKKEQAKKEDELNKTVSDLERDLADIEKDQEVVPAAEPAAAAPKAKDAGENRGGYMPEIRGFKSMNFEQRSKFFEREDIKEWVAHVREISSKRDVTGKDLLIPTIAVDMIREDAYAGSKLISHIRNKMVAGNTRQVVAGVVPEAVWTEMYGKLNELAITFTEAEVDGYKVAGFVPIPNALLEDNDINLGSELLSMLGESLAIALDKAILYGTGTKMPLGIVTRLVQTVKPTGYSDKERAWVDLHTSNVISIEATKTDKTLFQAIVTASGAAKKGDGEFFWACNHTTKTALLAASIGYNASAAIVAGMNSTMPVVGGAIEELEFIPDNVIIGGFGQRYLLSERAGMTVDVSTECQFIEDNTVYRCKARYDGTPVIAEAFVAVGINGVTPTATMTFATDSANA